MRLSVYGSAPCRYTLSRVGRGNKDASPFRRFASRVVLESDIHRCIQGATSDAMERDLETLPGFRFVRALPETVSHRVSTCIREGRVFNAAPRFHPSQSGREQTRRTCAAETGTPKTSRYEAVSAGSQAV